MDIVRKNGDKIDIEILEKKIGCRVVEISALKGLGVDAAAEAAVAAAQKKKGVPTHSFSGAVEHALAHIEEAAIHDMPANQQRWYAIKIFERDEKALEQLGLTQQVIDHIENDIKAAEAELDDDAESIIANERYTYITGITSQCCKKKNLSRQTVSDKIDKIVTNRILAFPIFVLIMMLVYVLSIGTVGKWTVDFMNEGLFGSFKNLDPGFLGYSLFSNWLSVPELLDKLLIGADGAPVVAQWLYSLIQDGIVGGVGAVLGFVPQIFVLFLLLSVLEDIGYMSRVAFIMDRLFRKFGLSGKSFIPMLVASGCGVPGIMASRTIEQERDRRITVMTTGFIPCSAKMPVVGMIAAALFGNSPLVATSAYFVGIGAVVISGVILKKTKVLAGKPAPFVMELPAYHAPLPANIFRATWERGWSFVKRAGTVIFAASVIIWLLNSLSFESGFHYVAGGEKSILNAVGEAIAVIFKPLGFGRWQAAVATILGLLAKEEIVGVFGSLSSMAGVEETNYAFIASEIFGGSKLSAYSFLMFNLLCAPCFAAMGAIRREMNSAKWTAGAIGYMCVFAYAVSLIVYQLGMFFMTFNFTVGTAAAIAVLAFMLFMLFRKNRHSRNRKRNKNKMKKSTGV